MLRLRKDKYNPKIMKYHVEVEEDDEDVDEDLEREIKRSTKALCRRRKHTSEICCNTHACAS